MLIHLGSNVGSAGRVLSSHSRCVGLSFRLRCCYLGEEVRNCLLLGVSSLCMISLNCRYAVAFSCACCSCRGCLYSLSSLLNGKIDDSGNNIVFSVTDVGSNRICGSYLLICSCLSFIFILAKYISIITALY